jgi:hypothetical protein
VFAVSANTIIGTTNHASFRLLAARSASRAIGEAWRIRESHGGQP